MDRCTTHRLVAEVQPARLSQQLRVLPDGVDSAGILKDNGHLVVLVSPGAVPGLCSQHAHELKEGTVGQLPASA